jgi:hypothetical protein
MRKAAVALLPLIVVILATSVWGALSISVTPPVLDLEIRPGARKVLVLTVKNTGDVRVLVEPEVMDFDLSPTGTPLLSTGGSHWSCADWISMDKSAFELEPGARQDRQTVMAVPRGASGGRYCAVVFKATPAQKGGRESHLSIATRTGTLIMQTVPRHYVLTGHISDIEVTHQKDGNVSFTAYFINGSEKHVQIRPSCVIKGPEGRIIDRLKIDAGTGTVLPDGMRQLKTVWSNRRKMLPGKYSVEVLADYRGGKRVANSAEFTIN